MRITICGSIFFIPEMCVLKERLIARGHTVLLPRSAEEGTAALSWNDLLIQDVPTYASLKRDRMLEHFQKIQSSDAILVANYDKQEKTAYIGPNTFLEIGVAVAFGKSVFLLRPFFSDSLYYEELLGLSPCVLHDDVMAIPL